jgi:glycosyltransferase involved in cell wall biosynthesis
VNPGTPNDSLRASIVIPAHNEERSIARLLLALQNGAVVEVFEIVVVCNGCTDDTAGIARRTGGSATVVEIEKPSKKEALRLGDTLANAYPRVFVDADVEIGAADILSLVEPLRDGRILASAPRRELPRQNVGWFVRWYYDVWERLPQVRSGLFGRGVMALSKEGNVRVQALPAVMSDDLVLSEAFAPDERIIVEGAVVIVHPPRTIRDLIRRRVRVATGNAEADNAGLRTAGARTSIRTLLALGRSEPHLWPRLPVFVLITVVARISARRAIRSGDFQTWQRDESSRS